MISTYITKLYDRLDKITYERYGSSDNDLVMFVISQNYGLEQHPILLPPGLKITLPDAPVKQTVTAPTTIALW